MQGDISRVFALQAFEPTEEDKALAREVNDRLLALTS